MSRNRPELHLRVPHPATIIERNKARTIKHTLYPTEGEPTPRATFRDEPEFLHAMRVRDMDIGVFVIEHGEPEHLPDPSPDTYHIVSKLTILAARRAKRTTDDLLFLWRDIRTADGRIRGVKGLGRVTPQSRPAQDVTIGDFPKGANELINTVHIRLSFLIAPPRRTPRGMPNPERVFVLLPNRSRHWCGMPWAGPSMTCRMNSACPCIGRTCLV